MPHKNSETDVINPFYVATGNYDTPADYEKSSK